MNYQLSDRPFDGLTAGKFIKAVVLRDPGFAEIFTGKIFPSLAVAKTKLPYLVYYRQNVTPQYCKDGCYQDETTVTVTVCDDDYERCMLLICGLRDLFECKSFPEYNVSNIEILGASEEVSDDGFELTLTLKIIFI